MLFPRQNNFGQFGQRNVRQRPASDSNDRITPAHLWQMDFHGATKEYVFDLIAAAFSIETPSPDFLSNVTASLPSCPRFDWYTASQPRCDIIKQVPGVNDVMSGALPVRTSRIRRASNDSTVCTDTPNSQATNMPFRLINRDAIVSFDLFRDPNNLSKMPADALTTVWGLSRAYNEVITNYAENPGFDEILLGAIAKRAGRPDPQKLRSGRAVIYPEDLLPYVAADTALFDHCYWKEVSDQGQLWLEMPPID